MNNVLNSGGASSGHMGTIIHGSNELKPSKSLHKESTLSPLAQQQMQLSHLMQNHYSSLE